MRPFVQGGGFAHDGDCFLEERGGVDGLSQLKQCFPQCDHVVRHLGVVGRKHRPQCRECPTEVDFGQGEVTETRIGLSQGGANLRRDVGVSLELSVDAHRSPVEELVHA